MGFGRCIRMGKGWRRCIRKKERKVSDVRGGGDVYHEILLCY